ncbi:MAG: sulfatase-like hydrolase/transferase [Phycisphaerae bacterium]|nr:sulfatase-like hydrolase/transferase [Phycisphaerae bacterium]MDP7289242.1 sulfatase-like hydrolase/transferase [Phycisphaerae bacterium]
MKKLNRRGFLKAAAVGAVGLSLPLRGVAKDMPARKPNIIFIMVDDMGYHDLGCFGSKTIQTPNIDKMCAEGIKFTDCYSGDTVCAPARSTLMTGTHKGHTPVRGNNGGVPLHPEDVTVAEVLKKAGYATGGFGKWGLGNQGKDGAAERQGFDLFFGYYNQWHAHTYYTHLFRNSVKVELNGRYTHHAIFDETIKFIKASADKPFLCYCPWTPPHAAYQIPDDEPAWALYKDKPWKDKSAKVVAAMDSMMDRQVGEILALLKELKIDDNTIVFFTSDNGAARRFDGIHNSCGKMKGHKRSMNEGGIRVPMVVRWPGKIKPGQVSDLPWYFPDVMPTFAELAGVSGEVPKETDGISIVPTLLGKGAQQKHEFLFWSSGVHAVRMGKWKGIGGGGKRKSPLRLYDLSKDIGEANDVAAQHPDIVKKITAIMDREWVAPRKQVDDGKYTGRPPRPKRPKKNKKKA